MEMRALVETISRMTTSDEMRGGMDCEDAIETMDRLIVEARACVAAESAAPRWPTPDLPPPKPGDAVFVVVVHPDMKASQDHFATGPQHAAACGALLLSFANRTIEGCNCPAPQPIVAAIRFMAAAAGLKPGVMQ
jgi:hypothetical protein